jgi:hypothetical protein
MKVPNKPKSYITLSVKGLAGTKTLFSFFGPFVIYAKK